MQTKHISIYTIASRAMVAIGLLLTPQLMQAQKKTIATLEKDTTATFQGLQVMADLVGVAQLAVSDYGQYEAGLRVNLKDKYFPVVEVGYGKADHHNDVTQTDYSTSAPYGKIGIDFNVLKNKHDIYKVYVGARLAYTSFKFDIAHPDVKDPVWGTMTPYGGKDIKAHYGWMEAVFGIDAKILGPLHLGWSVRYKRRLNHKVDEMGNCWYVPGYGKSGSNLITGTFNVMINI